MDATTIVALAGIGGTVAGAAVGATGVVKAAAINARAQHNVQDQNCRRQAYAACASAFLARHDAAEELMQTLKHEPRTTHAARARDLASEHTGLMEKVGVVIIEGPGSVAHAAAHTARVLNVWIERLRGWAEEEDAAAHARDQWRYGREDELYADQAIRQYGLACRRVLHPQEDRRRRRSPNQVVNEWLWGLSQRRGQRRAERDETE